MRVLSEDFFDDDVLSVARKLLGKFVVCGDLVGRIVETEAYSEGDPASHSFSGKGFRNAVMFGRAGRAYVYFTYGMYYCFNVVCGDEGKGEAVLIRAVEPVCGAEEMGKNRRFFQESGDGDTSLDEFRLASGRIRDESRKGLFRGEVHASHGGLGWLDKDLRGLTNGPAKFCMAFGVDRSFNGVDLLSGDGVYLAEGDGEDFATVSAKRVGISKGTERLWRFYVEGNEFVSRA